MVKNDLSHWTWIVAQVDPCVRSDEWIHRFLSEQRERDELPLFSRSQIKKLIQSGAITVNGLPIKPSASLKAGVEIALQWSQKSLLKRDSTLKEVMPPFLFEDEHLIVLNKPSALTVHPSPTQMDSTLVQILLNQGCTLSRAGGELRPGVVHRLDKNTSGALVLAKTDEAYYQMVPLFAQHTIERIYWGLCYGAPKLPKISVQSLLGRNPVDRKKFIMNAPRGKRAVSHVTQRKAFALPSGPVFAAWVEVALETGRTHQIRVHMTGIGNSLLGDPVYGVPQVNQWKWLTLPADIQAAVRKLPGQALHARTLGFVHPITQEKLLFQADPPEDFQQLLEKLSCYEQ